MLRAVICSIAFTAALAAPAVAQNDPADPGARGRANRPRPGLTNAELVSMLDTYAIVQAQEALQLNDTQYGQFVTRLKKLQETRRRNQQERNQILQDLRRLSDPQATAPDEAAIRERLKALRSHDERTAADLRRAYEAVDELLDAAQQARFRVFEETMERRKLDLLVRARERVAMRRGRP